LDEEYTSFLHKFPSGSILISFGHQFTPNHQDLSNLLNAISHLPDIGFIFSISDENAKNIAIPELDNLLHKEFIEPMKRLLSDDKVIGFITHCGVNSMLEAI